MSEAFAKKSMVTKDDRFPDALTDVGAEAAVARGTLSL